MQLINQLCRQAVQTYPFRRGKSRLRDLAMKCIHGRTIAVDQWNHPLLLDLDNLLDSIVYLDRQYEAGNLLVLADWVENNACRYFMDIGANIGLYTTFFAANRNIEKVYAFEPDPRNFAQLMANIFLNRQYEKVKPFQDALSSEPGSAKFYASWDRSKTEVANKLNTSASSLDYFPSRHAGATVVEASLRRGDDLVDFRGEKIAIKIDVEGHELSVLMGLTRTLRENDCLVLVEVWNRGNDQAGQVDALMHGLGYQKDTGPQDNSDNFVYVKKTSSEDPHEKSIKEQITNLPMVAERNH